MLRGPAAPAAVMRGRAPVEQYARGAFVAIPDLHLDKLEEWVTPGGGVIASWFRFSGTFTAPLVAPNLPPLVPTDGLIELFGMDRSEIRDGRLARHQIFSDILEFGRQIGAFPQRGTRAERLSRRLLRLTARRMRRPLTARAPSYARPGTDREGSRGPVRGVGSEAHARLARRRCQAPSRRLAAWMRRGACRAAVIARRSDLRRRHGFRHKSDAAV